MRHGDIGGAQVEGFGCCVHRLALSENVGRDPGKDRARDRADVDARGVGQALAREVDTLDRDVGTRGS